MGTGPGARRKRRARRAARRDARKPRQQYYGGTPEAADQLRARNQAGIDAGTELEQQGLAGLDAERAKAGEALTGLGNDAQRLQRAQARNARAYGAGADRALADYSAGRSPILDNAAALEKSAVDATGRYQDVADAAERASQERTQRQALSLAAGRGNDSIRTALAASAAANRDAAVQGQVTRADELNKLMGFEADARARAADIRSGVGAADQRTADIQAGRQQVATGATSDALGQRAGLTTADAQLGTGVAGTRVNSGANRRGDFLGAEGQQETAQLGSNMDYEEKRRAAQKGPIFKAGSVLFDPANLFNRDKSQ